MIMVTLEEVKKQCRIDDDITTEDDVLTLYGDSAEETVVCMLNRTIEDLFATYGDIPSPVKHAVLMLAAHSYAHREPASVQNLYTVPYTLDALIKPYMIL